MNTSVYTWQSLSLPPEKLATARQEVYMATQIVAAVSATYLPSHPDMSHTALQLDPSGHILGQEIKPGKTFRVRLDLHHLRLELQGHGLKGFETVADFGLVGHTLKAAFDWMEQALQAYLGAAMHKKLLRLADLPWTLPSHPLSSGALFRAPNQSSSELYHWFANAENVLQEIQALHPMNASRLSLWPKHFDLFFGFMRPVYSVAIGFSAGDAVLKEPYFYVKPAPLLPEPLPVLTYGEWLQGKWSGAVLKSSEIFASGDSPQAQREQVWKFLHSTLGVLNWLV